MTAHTIEYIYAPSCAKNGKHFKEDAPGTYQIGDTVTWTAHFNAEGGLVNPSARKSRLSRPVAESRTYTLHIDGAGKEFMNEFGKMRQRFYGEITTIIESP